MTPATFPARSLPLSILHPLSHHLVPARQRAVRLFKPFLGRTTGTVQEDEAQAARGGQVGSSVSTVFKRGTHFQARATLTRQDKDSPTLGVASALYPTLGIADVIAEDASTPLLAADSGSPMTPYEAAGTMAHSHYPSDDSTTTDVSLPAVSDVVKPETVSDICHAPESHSNRPYAPCKDSPLATTVSHQIPSSSSLILQRPFQLVARIPRSQSPDITDELSMIIKWIDNYPDDA